MEDIKIIEKPLIRLNQKITTENLWIYLLSLLKKEDMYAYEINSRLEERFGFSVGQVTAYVVLYKLERAGYVEAEWKHETRKRKYYKITEKGIDLLEKGLRFMEGQVENIRG